MFSVARVSLALHLHGCWLLVGGVLGGRAYLVGDPWSQSFSWSFGVGL